MKFICTDCGKPCHAGIVDFGIGCYEYWGAKGVDKNEQFVSQCCEAPVTTPDGEPYTKWDALAEAQEQRADDRHWERQ